MAIVRKTPLATIDLTEIWLYIARDNQEMADRLIEEIEDALCLLAQRPRLGRERSELAPSLRSFGVRDFLVFYRPIENGIAVFRVVHGRRDLDSISWTM